MCKKIINFFSYLYLFSPLLCSSLQIQCIAFCRMIHTPTHITLYGIWILDRRCVFRAQVAKCLHKTSSLNVWLGFKNTSRPYLESCSISSEKSQGKCQKLNEEQSRRVSSCIRSKTSWKWLLEITSPTAQKMKFSIRDFFSKCDQIRSLPHNKNSL